MQREIIKILTINDLQNIIKQMYTIFYKSATKQNIKLYAIGGTLSAIYANNGYIYINMMLI